MEDSSSLRITCRPTGRNGTATLIARLGGDVLAVEPVNLTNPKARTSFAQSLCAKYPGIERTAMEAELLRLAADVTDHKAAQPSDSDALSELDVSSIIRPERFIVSELSGLAVPIMTNVGDKPVGRWLQYLRWADGRREQRTLGATIDLPGNRRLWIHPVPSVPTPSMAPGWSRDARQAWIDGAPAPDPADVFHAICERIAQFLDLPRSECPGITATLALWVIFTYCFQAWNATPYLFVGGPLGAGKSRVFEILARLVFRPLGSSNMTGAALFRTLHNQGGTLLLDEAERLKQTKDPGTAELSSMLLAGYKRGGQATRLEPMGDTFKMVAFDVFGPKAMACIAGLPPALASRAIPLTMFRASPGSDKPRRRIDADPAAWRKLRDDLHSLALEHGPTWLELPERVGVCPMMSGRDFELWQPLLALAAWIESHGAQGLLKLLQEHAMRTIAVAKDEQTPDHDETLLRLLAEAVHRGERPTSGEILEMARTAEPGVYERWTARGVSEHLKRYKLTTNKTDGRKRYARVTLEDLQRIQVSYGIDLDLPHE